MVLGGTIIEQMEKEREKYFNVFWCFSSYKFMYDIQIQDPVSDEIASSLKEVLDWHYKKKSMKSWKLFSNLKSTTTPTDVELIWKSFLFPQ